MVKYVDGFVAAVPTANREAFRAHAEYAAAIFREFGALQAIDCWGDDVPEGTLTSFPTAVKCRDDETVCFSWVLWPSREVRDEAMPKIMARMQEENQPMPFDGQRMIFGSFEVIVDA